MYQVMVLARLIAALIGSSFSDEWACWENTYPQDGGSRYVCEYREHAGTAQAGLFAYVWSSWDDGHLEWTVGALPPYVPTSTSVQVALDPGAWTLVLVESGGYAVLHDFDGEWKVVDGPLQHVGQLDLARTVWLPPGEGSVNFVSEGPVFVAVYRYHGYIGPPENG